MIKRSSRNWIPFWGDKWLFGSMRIEFDVTERGIWWDLMSIAIKDEGFIRANEDTPYLTQQLAGMLIIPEDLLEKTIEKFIEKGKYTRLKNGTLYITNWNKYCFTDRHMRRFEDESEDEMSAEKDTMSGNADKVGAVADTREEKIRVDKNREEENRKDYPSEFEAFWKNYPKKKEKKDAYITWQTLTKKQKEEVIIAAKHYKMETDAMETDESYIKNPKTFLNKKKEKWKDYLEPPKITKQQTCQEKDDKRAKEWLKEED